MRIKRRYVLVYMSGVDNRDEFEKRLFATVNRLSPLFAIKANLRTIKELYMGTKDGILGVISVNNEYKYEAIFILSLIGKFYKSNLLTLKSSGSLKSIKLEETRHGTSTK